MSAACFRPGRRPGEPCRGVARSRMRLVWNRHCGEECFPWRHLGAIPALGRWDLEEKFTFAAPDWRVCLQSSSEEDGFEAFFPDSRIFHDNVSIVVACHRFGFISVFGSDAWVGSCSLCPLRRQNSPYCIVSGLVGDVMGGVPAGGV